MGGRAGFGESIGDIWGKTVWAGLASVQKPEEMLKQLRQNIDAYFSFDFRGEDTPYHMKRGPAQRYVVLRPILLSS